MSQDMRPVIDATATSGSVLADYLNDERTTLLTQHSGTSAPSYAQTGTIWLNTSDGELKIETASGTERLVDFIDALDLGAGGTVTGSITVSGDGYNVKSPHMVIQPDAAKTLDNAELVRCNKAGVIRCNDYYSEADDARYVALYDASGVYQSQASFAYSGTYSAVQFTTGVVKANDRYVGGGTNQAAIVQNESGGGATIGDASYITTLAGTPNTLRVTNSAASVTYILSVDATSDSRIKSNIVDTASDSLAEINAIRLVDHDYSVGPQAGQHVDVNVIAQELAAVIPAAVYTAEQPDGSALPKDLKSINTYPLIMRLIGAVQQLSARVSELEG